MGGRRARLALRLCAAATLALPGVQAPRTFAMGAFFAPRPPAAASPSRDTARGALGAGSAVLVFAPPSAHTAPAAGRALSEQDAFQAGLTDLPGMSVAIMSATQGFYSRAQMLLDITQGARVASSSYSRPRPAAISLRASGAGALVEGFAAARRRAEGAPQLLRPGLLAAQIPAGAGYVGSDADDLDGLLAADRSGRVANLSLGSASTLTARIAALGAQSRLVVADLPGGLGGYADLRTLAEARAPGELLLVIQRAGAPRGHELLWAGAAGLSGDSRRTLSSQTTNERGLISAVDVAPTILRRLGLAIPADMRGTAIHTDGALHPSSLRALMARLRVISERRPWALRWALAAWVLLVVISAPWPRSRAWAIRAGGIGALWSPIVVLAPAALATGAGVEYAIIAAGCLALGALTDLLLPWPRAPLAPAIAAMVILASDALAGTQLLVRSVLGPDPALGARFYGIGNELKSGLAVLVLAAVAAWLYPSPSGGDGREPSSGDEAAWRRRAVATMAGAGVLLAVIEGSARIGAGVGGVILVSAGFAVASVMLLPGALTRRRALTVLATPIVALILLAAVDLATAHGSGHYTGSILHARSAADLRDVIVRRYTAAWDELRSHAIPYLTAVALACSLLALREHRRVLSPVAGDPVWEAAFAGGLTAGVVGALVEDSGPLLFLVAVLALGCVLAYLWGRPQSLVVPSPGRLRPVGSLAA